MEDVDLVQPGDCQSQKGERKMPAISPQTGPVAVTGASGYIGSWIVQDCVEQGYQVHACVRDKNKPEKVDHLLAMNDAGYLGRVELFEADLFENGSYDEPFAECAGVIHAAAPSILDETHVVGGPIREKMGTDTLCNGAIVLFAPFPFSKCGFAG